MTTYSNPRLHAVIPDWPFGRQTTTAEFEVSPRNKRGVRIGRRTRNKTDTGWNKVKLTVYAESACIVDGDDGKTYLLLKSDTWRSIEIVQGTMKFSHGHASHPEPEYDALLALLAEANQTAAA